MYNPGNAPAHPIIKFTGPGRIHQLKNLTTDDEINFNYTMQTGETVVLNLETKTIISNFYGNLLTRGAIIPGSDFSNFRLLKGENAVSLLIDSASATAFVSFTPQYLSFDG